MKEVCFYMCYYSNYIEVARKLIRSIKRFYPDTPVLEYISVGNFDLKEFCDWHLEIGMKLLNEYKRVISLDPDEVMCAKCPDLFGDFDLGVVQNNIPFFEFMGSDHSGVYINAGMTVCTNKDVWEEWMREYKDRCKDFPGEGLNEQNALNWIFHTSKHKVELLEFPDRTYGISAMDYGYPNMYLKGDDLWVKWKAGEQWHDKKLCIFHAAGVEWKNKETGEYNFNLIHDPAAREKLISLTC